MTTSDKLREIAERDLNKRIVGILMAHSVNSIDAFNSTPDLTALISENYYPKEFVEWLLRQDSYPDNGRTYFLVSGVAGDDSALLFYHWNKYARKENEQ